MIPTTDTKTYIAIIGDIKDSRHLENRKEVQVSLKKVLDMINHKYKDDLASKFTITLGDEFQGLLVKRERILKIITEIELAMHPVYFRFGIGIGEISTDIDYEISIGADGPAYYRAREAIIDIKEKEKKKRTCPSTMKLCMEEVITQDLINTIFVLLTTIKEKWTDRQIEIIKYIFCYQEDQWTVANRLQVRQSTIQKALASGKYYAYKEALDTIERILSE